MYQVLARKYRPQTFGELIGQEHVQKTLANAIVSNRLAHGYIFSGQRGTGKTTVARILARCLNCIEGPTVTPCGVCSSCLEIAAGNSVDVIEIDAASNRGIDEMREVRENVRYRPARDRYKVFIIDEAHQITKEAFNALLKTLEEPPEWVVFILCTTEPYEIPNTIASRCQHFSFRSVDFAELMDRLKQIAVQEGIAAGEDVLSVIARAGDGSVRDSLSALDQAIACCGKTLSVEDVRGLLGVFGIDSLRAVAEGVHRADGAQMLEIVQELERNGQSLQHFCRELARYWRNLLVALLSVKPSGKPTPLIASSEAEQQELLETARLFSEEDLTRYLNLTLDLYKALQYSLQPRLHLELGLIKLVQAGKLQSIEVALADLDKAGNPQVKAAPNETRKGDLRQELRESLSKAGMHHSADAVERSELRMEGNDLVIRAPKSIALLLKDAEVQRAVSQLLGRAVRVRIESSEDKTPESHAGDETELRERALSHPGVKRFQELFPGAQVRTVRNLNE